LREKIRDGIPGIFEKIEETMEVSRQVEARYAK